MLEKDPSIVFTAPFWWVGLLSVWGGIVGYIRKVKSGVVKRFSLTELIGEIFTSGFVGAITFLMCESAHIDRLAAAALVGISGHMGSRSIFLMEQFLQNRFLKNE